MLKLKCYKTNLGYFYRGMSSAYAQLIVNGRPISELEQASVPNWHRLDDEIKTVQMQTPGKVVQTGWSLRDKTLKSDRIPDTLTLQQLYEEYDLDDLEYVARGEYAGLHPLYDRVVEQLPSEMVDVDFEVTQLGELTISDYGRPETMQVTMDRGPGLGKPINETLANVVVYEDFEHLFTPEFLLHKRPCSLTSRQMYSIVRNHIKANIDYSIARITSDYDFCFTVKKIAKDNMPVASATPTPRTRKKSLAKSVKLIPYFSMTWAGYRGNGGYEGYECISGMSAKSLSELQTQLAAYLDDLISDINLPLIECPHCAATGYQVVVRGTNAR